METDVPGAVMPDLGSSMSRALRVLLVEDDSDFREIVREVLVGAEFDVLALGDGSAALDILERERFDVVLSDLRLPGADGLAVVRACGRAPGHPAVVVMTAFPGWKVEEETRQAGAARVLSKPFELGQLERILREVNASRGDSHE